MGPLVEPLIPIGAAICWIGWLIWEYLYRISGPKVPMRMRRALLALCSMALFYVPVLLLFNELKGTSLEPFQLVFVLFVAYIGLWLNDFIIDWLLSRRRQLVSFETLQDPLMVLRRIEFGWQVEWDSKLSGVFDQADQSVFAAIHTEAVNPAKRVFSRTLVCLISLALACGFIALIGSTSEDTHIALLLFVTYFLIDALVLRASMRKAERVVLKQVGAQTLVRTLSKFYGRLPVTDPEVFAGRSWLRSESYLTRAVRLGVKLADARSLLFDARRAAEMDEVPEVRSSLAVADFEIK